MLSSPCGKVSRHYPGQRRQRRQQVDNGWYLDKCVQHFQRWAWNISSPVLINFISITRGYALSLSEVDQYGKSLFPPLRLIIVSILYNLFRIPSMIFPQFPGDFAAKYFIHGTTLFWRVLLSTIGNYNACHYMWLFLIFINLSLQPLWRAIFHRHHTGQSMILRVCHDKQYCIATKIVSTSTAFLIIDAKVFY